MGIARFLVFFIPFFITLSHSSIGHGNAELKALMAVKAALDPHNTLLTSWNADGDPCNGSFEGIACNEKGQVANISLQGKKLSGMIPASIAELKHLTSLYLHYNFLTGKIPGEISTLTELQDLYLNVNKLSGNIPSEIGNMSNLQVLQLCCNQFTDSIPAQLGFLKNLVVLTLQSNRLTGAIPGSLGDLKNLMWLDLSFNYLSGSIPTKLAEASKLDVLDIRNNNLAGSVPPALKRLDDRFFFENNSRLCGESGDWLMPLRACNASTGQPTRSIPEPVDLKLPCNQTHCSDLQRARSPVIIVCAALLGVALSAIGLVIISLYRRKKQKLGSSFHSFDPFNINCSTDKGKEVCMKHGSSLVSLEYSNGWDPLGDGCNLGFSKEDLQSFSFNLEEVEAATQYFSEVNFLGKSHFSATYKGILRDGSVVAVKRINKTSCKSEKCEFLNGLDILVSLKHENLVNLRGFCFSKGRGECFLIYDFVPNGNISSYLDAKDGDRKMFEWSTRVSIINGIAKGIEYLHACKVNKPALVHQNISAEKVLIDQQFNPLISDSGLHKLLTNDNIFSALKTSAAMGYLAPEYMNTGRFTEKSDVYAFGMLVLQVLSGRQKLNGSIRQDAELCRFQDFIDPNLHGEFSEHEAAKLAKIAVICTEISPTQRPSMEAVIQELSI
ncbi:probable leucine-rich repeat receptor-like protein kinase At5g63930 [Malania oleifera]|uniref:probable leucine-rich repeat receptor-like protein kinase At5g63930 n=1 Tax=Malania oleifera TaxID=397392 RepID=UPI0025AE4FCE|nr:probable leucine-rich repeat receptor-like protein kinase At5g63930 [Malania oleifera]